MRRDYGAVMSLRDGLGKFIEGSSTTLPVVQVDNKAKRPRGEYYISFQDPAGSPTANPLIINGKTYIKIGWNAFTESSPYYGWTGENVANPSIALSGYDDVSGYSEASKSYIYDDYGRMAVFGSFPPSHPRQLTLQSNSCRFRDRKRRVQCHHLRRKTFEGLSQ